MLTKTRFRCRQCGKHLVLEVNKSTAKYMYRYYTELIDANVCDALLKCPNKCWCLDSHDKTRGYYYMDSQNRPLFLCNVGMEFGIGEKIDINTGEYLGSMSC